jgi:hypothetical protein
MSFNFARVLAWARNPKRKPVNLAFPDVADREAAELVEYIEEPLQKRIAELETENTRLKALAEG